MAIILFPNNFRLNESNNNNNFDAFKVKTNSFKAKKTTKKNLLIFGRRSPKIHILNLDMAPLFIPLVKLYQEPE